MKKIGIIPVVCLLLWSGCSEHQSEKTDFKVEKKVRFDPFLDKRVSTVYLYMHQPNFWEKMVEYKDYSDTKGKTIYLPADVVVHDSLIENCGVRFKGESSYGYPSKKKSIKIDLTEFNGRKQVFGRKKMNLVNCFKDPTYIREKIFFEALERLGGTALHTNFVRVYVNEKYWGLYLQSEEVDGAFLTRKFGSKKGALFKGEPKAFLNYLGPDTNAYASAYIRKNKRAHLSKIAKLTRVLNDVDDGGAGLNSSAADYYDNVAGIINLDNMLKAWALCNVMLNVDAFNLYYPHNYYLFENPKTKKFEWIPYDANYAFAAWTPDLKYHEAVKFPLTGLDESRNQHEVVNRLFKNELILEKYYGFVADILDNDFNVDSMTHRVNIQSELIEKYVETDSMKMYSTAKFKYNLHHFIGDSADPGAFIPGILDFTRDRAAFLRKSLPVNDRK